jgi:hypothetical protein
MGTKIRVQSFQIEESNWLQFNHARSHTTKAEKADTPATAALLAKSSSPI